MIKLKVREALADPPHQSTLILSGWTLRLTLSSMGRKMLRLTPCDHPDEWASSLNKIFHSQWTRSALRAMASLRRPAIMTRIIRTPHQRETNSLIIWARRRFRVQDAHSVSLRTNIRTKNLCSKWSSSQIYFILDWRSTLTFLKVKLKTYSEAFANFNLVCDAVKLLKLRADQSNASHYGIQSLSYLQNTPFLEKEALWTT